MIPGPDYVYECPNCGNYLTRGSLASGNTFGEKIYSDGKRIAPNLPEFPDLTKCKKCGAICWLSKLEEVGTYYGTGENTAWERADEAEFLVIEDYYDAINKGIAENKDDEVFIRQQIWWSYNDRTRNGQELFRDESDELRWIENVTALRALLDPSDIHQKIMIAEINRNLGDYDSCISVMESIDNGELDWVKIRFLDECKRKNKLVVELD